MQSLFLILALLAGAGFFALRLGVKPALAFFVQPAADRARIKANLESLQGEAGPARRVRDIAYVGAKYPGRYDSAKRIYLVTLEKRDGGLEYRRVMIEVALIGQGRMTIEPGLPHPVTGQ